MADRRQSYRGCYDGILFHTMEHGVPARGGTGPEVQGGAAFEVHQGAADGRPYHEAGARCVCVCTCVGALGAALRAEELHMNGELEDSVWTVHNHLLNYTMDLIQSHAYLDAAHFLLTGRLRKWTKRRWRLESATK